MINKVQLIGNLGADPTRRFTASGRCVTSFPVATHEQWNDNKGDKQQRTTWHRVVVWGKQAENCANYLSKSRKVFVEGKLQNRSYKDDKGNERFVTEVIARQVHFLDNSGNTTNTTDPDNTEDNQEDNNTPDDNTPPVDEGDLV